MFDAKEQGLDPAFRLTRYANVKVRHYLNDKISSSEKESNIMYFSDWLDDSRGRWQIGKTIFSDPDATLIRIWL